MTLFLATVGTACTLIASLLFAFVLSKKDSMLHSFFTFAAVFTMYFNGGMIPTYLIVKEVGLLDTLWSLIIPGLISTYYVIILRTAIMGIPQERTQLKAKEPRGTVNAKGAHVKDVKNRYRVNFKY